MCKRKIENDKIGNKNGEVLSSIKRFGIKENRSIAVFGFGPVGLTFIRFMSLLGVHPIIAFDMVDEKVQDALSKGADYAFNSKNCDPNEEIHKICPDGVQFVLDAVGLLPLINASMEYIFKPNPRLTPVYEGIKIAREKKVEMILAVGGGSVITRESDLMKCSCCTDLFYPKFAMLDPQLCYTLPDHQISAGGTDILAHVMERYFVLDDNHEFSDRMCEAAMISLIHNLPKVLADKKNYDAWAEVMWIGNVAHNGLLSRGKRDDWGSHDIEHQLSAHYDIAHGAGLAIIFPAWMKYVWKEKPSMMEQYAVRVWGVSTEGKTQEEIVLEGIQKTEDFYHSIGLVTRLSDAGIDDHDFEIMAKKAVSNGPLGNFKKLHYEDVLNIYRLAL